MTEKTELTAAKRGLLRRMEKHCYLHPKNLALEDATVDRWRQKMAAGLRALGPDDTQIAFNTADLPEHLIQPLLKAAESMRNAFDVPPVTRSYDHNPDYVDVSRDFLQCAYAMADQYISLPERLRDSTIQATQGVFNHSKGLITTFFGLLHQTAPKPHSPFSHAQVDRQTLRNEYDDAIRGLSAEANQQLVGAARSLFAPVDWDRKFDESLQQLATQATRPQPIQYR